MLIPTERCIDDGFRASYWAKDVIKLRSPRKRQERMVGFVQAYILDAKNLSGTWPHPDAVFMMKLYNNLVTEKREPLFKESSAVYLIQKFAFNFFSMFFDVRKRPSYTKRPTSNHQTPGVLALASCCATDCHHDIQSLIKNRKSNL